MFENAQRQPPTDPELLAYEAEVRGSLPELPFRVLKDPRIISMAYRDTFGALPYIIVLDGRMVVYKHGAGVPERTYLAWMEELMTR